MLKTKTISLLAVLVWGGVTALMPAILLAPATQPYLRTPILGTCLIGLTVTGMVLSGSVFRKAWIIWRRESSK